MIGMDWIDERTPVGPTDLEVGQSGRRSADEEMRPTRGVDTRRRVGVSYDRSRAADTRR